MLQYLALQIAWGSAISNMSAPASKTWDSASEAYAPFEAFTAKFTRAAAEALPGLLPTGSPKVMDVAAGTGASTFAVCKVLGEHCRVAGTSAEVVATDFSESMLNKLSGKLSSPSSDAEVAATQAAVEEGLLKISSGVADAQDLSAYEDGFFDVITCSFGIMFPPSPEKVVREFWRLLKPGGVAFTTTWHYNNMTSDIMVDLAHTFKGRGRFEDLPLVTATLKFGNETFMRRLFRGDLDDGPRLWKDSDLEPRFVSDTHQCMPRHLAATLNKNPVASQLSPWDEEAAEKYLQERWGGPDGQLPLGGTALILIARKPA